MDHRTFSHAVETPNVIPAEAGIQYPSLSWIPARASYRQLGRNDNGLGPGVIPVKTGIQG